MIYNFYSGKNQVPKEKGSTTTLVCCLCPTDQTGSSNRSNRSAWKPCANTGQTKTSTQHGQTGLARTEGCTLSPQVCNPPTP